MFKNYLTIALRNLRKHPAYTSINVFGLSLGLAAALLIFLYARNELTYDRAHENAERIYIAYKERVTPTGVQATYDTWVPLLDRMRADLPGIAGGARALETDMWVQQGERKFEEVITYADPSYLSLFTFPFARGNPEDPLPDENSVVVSEAVAQKYFGEADPLGQVLTLAFERDYTVTGVMGEIPLNSTEQPSIVVPLSSAPWYDEAQEEWGGSFISTYLLLDENTAVADLEARFPALIESIWDAETAGRTNFKLLPLLEAHDTFAGNRKYAFILLAVALVTILIACINFINLATARSLERAKEVGMRKVLGARRGQLVRQFLAEAALLGLGALILGLALAQLVLPTFNRLYELDLRLNLLAEPLLLPALLVLALAVGVLSGAYPAFFLARFRPVASLRGKLAQSPGGLRLRQGLLVVQFALSIVLIAGTLIMIKQVRHMKTADLSFEKENVVVLPVEASDFADAEAAAAQLATFKEELARGAGVASVASSSHIPGNWGGWFTFAWPEGWGEDDSPLRVRLSYMDSRYFDTYGIPFVEGRNFAEGSEADRENAVIINKSAVRDFGWETAVGKTVRRGETPYEIVGVVEDYNFESLENAVAPVLHFYRPPENGVHNYVSVRLKAGADVGAALDGMRARFHALDPSRTFDYFFVDERFNELYQAQDRLVAVASAFAVLAILIACLGLFGLASLMVTQRTKEIGVRKVLGASAAQIVMLLSKGYARLVLVAFVLAVPLAYFAMDRWLDDFAYRTDIGVGVFALAGASALLIAFLTVSVQALRAASTNPTETLRYE